MKLSPENGERLTGKDVDDLQKASRRQKSEQGKARAEARNASATECGRRKKPKPLQRPKRKTASPT